MSIRSRITTWQNSRIKAANTKARKQLAKARTAAQKEKVRLGLEREMLAIQRKVVEARRDVAKERADIDRQRRELGYRPLGERFASGVEKTGRAFASGMVKAQKVAGDISEGTYFRGKPSGPRRGPARRTTNRRSRGRAAPHNDSFLDSLY